MASTSQTPTADPVVQTYTQNQKQRIAESTAKLAKIDNDELKNFINDKTEEIKEKIGDFQVPTPIDAADIAATLDQLVTENENPIS
ncbi:1154_t:CDS:2, partial [Cetraspora pellucida]